VALSRRQRSRAPGAPWRPTASLPTCGTAPWRPSTTSVAASPSATSLPARACSLRRPSARSRRSPPTPKASWRCAVVINPSLSLPPLNLRGSFDDNRCCLNRCRRKERWLTSSQKITVQSCLASHSGCESSQR
jgi:hypothetical protein